MFAAQVLLFTQFDALMLGVLVAAHKPARDGDITRAH